jgi:hypothetical protein
VDGPPFLAPHSRECFGFIKDWVEKKIRGAGPGSNRGPIWLSGALGFPFRLRRPTLCPLCALEP